MPDATLCNSPNDAQSARGTSKKVTAPASASETPTCGKLPARIPTDVLRVIRASLWPKTHPIKVNVCGRTSLELYRHQSILDYDEPMPIILIEVPADRRLCARLTLRDDGGQIHVSEEACVKADGLTAHAHGNDDQDPAQPYGHTPLGTYEIEGYQACPPGDSEERGPFDRIKLKPVSGDALSAAGNGRSGFQIYGGYLGALGNLRPTCGSIRISDVAMSRLLRKIGEKGALLRPAYCEIRQVATPGGTQVAPDEGVPYDDPSPDLARPVTVVPANPAPPPFIVSFTANPAAMVRGNSSDLQWQVAFASEVLFNGAPYANAATGSAQVTPMSTTTYLLVARGAGPEDARQVTVTVMDPPPPPPPPPPLPPSHDREPHDRFHDRMPV